MINPFSFSQQSHFVFLQAENHEPFYVLLNKKNYSASSIGYLILPKLSNGEYHIRLGFPKDKGAEQEYVLEIKDNDQGFLVKEFGEKGWGLFNLQSMDVQYAGETAKRKTEAIAKVESKEKPASDENINEKANITKSSLEATATTTNEITTTQWPILLSQTKTDSGFVYQYVVKNNEKQDTINAYIYVKNEVSTVAEIKAKDTVEQVKTELPKNELPTTTVKKDTITYIPVDENVISSNENIIPNTNCKTIADDKDFFKLRKKMVAVEDIEEMITIAKKALKEKCYTTEHVRNLSVLFLSDAGKYQFLDVAYPFTYDSYKYSSLVDLLKDNYYIDRFKAMIRK